MRFFLDGCISIVHAKALRLYYESEGHEFWHLTQRFDDPAIPDPDWIRALARDGEWIILSGDTRISTHPANKLAWHESGLTAFFFGEPWSETPRVKQAEELLRWFPRILAAAKRHRKGHGFHLAKSSKEPRQIYPDVRR